MNTLICDNKEDYNDVDTQDPFIANMNNSMAIVEAVKRDRNSSDPEVKMDYIGSAFIHMNTCITGSKSTFITDPISFISSGGTPCCSFPGRCVSKRSNNS